MYVLRCVFATIVQWKSHKCFTTLVCVAFRNEHAMRMRHIVI